MWQPVIVMIKLYGIYHHSGAELPAFCHGIRSLKTKCHLEQLRSPR